ncbi:MULTISPECIES: hypothetical protein [unclassified Streptomyces]|uniref:hypothetical protein n=1 Tax=unclassified Streptomyces TaxID=2593676 RepID=UPI00117DA962|nr:MULTISPECIES: hypothetical protein [unclassified Streptomyces]TRO59797.1 hypothetical protein E4K73_32245 [Streptomyces sp. IB201691-2A2]
MTGMTRRDVVRHTAVLGTATLMGGGSVLALPAGAAAAGRPGPGDAPKRPTSPNGWELEEKANDVSTVWTRPVPGTGLDVDVRIGDVETVLVHVVRRFHYEIDELRKGDLGGWRAPARVKLTRAEGNQASGTAVAIRPGSYPPGAEGGFYSPQLMVIRDILAECDGVVRWGGDDDRPYEALFSIDVPPGDKRLTDLVARLRNWADEPGAGPGTRVDVADAKRRAAATALERRQKKTA